MALIKGNHNPFIVGDWIKRDEDFIGRADLIEKYLALEKHSYWLIGARRMGKTSFLRFLQRQYRKDSSILPLFWDVSGANTPYDLKLSLLDSLDEAFEDLENRHIAIDPDRCESMSLLEILRHTAHLCKQHSVKLIFLIDEAEALFKVAANDANFLNRFRAILFNKDFVYVIIASNHGIYPHDATDFLQFSAPFLQSFIPPDYLMPWTEAEARQLIGKITRENALQEKIIRQSGCLPFIVQMICFYFYNHGDLSDAIANIEQENILDIFFRDDFSHFDRLDVQILSAASRRKAISMNTLHTELKLAAEKISQRLKNLTLLGFLKQLAEDSFSVSNLFLKSWAEKFLPQEFSPQTDSRGISEPTQLIVQVTAEKISYTLQRQDEVISAVEIQNNLDFEKFAIAELSLNSLQRLGKLLFHELFGIEQKQANALYREFVREENKRLIFAEEDDASIPLPLELLHDGRQFLVLQCELFRSVFLKNHTTHLQENFPNPLKILLLASDTPPHIPFVDNEALVIKDKLERISRELVISIQVTTLLSHDADYQTVINLLESEDFHFIHYAGHYGSAENQNYLYFRKDSAQNSPVQAMSLEYFFALTGGNLRFLYVNGCKSAADFGRFDKILSGASAKKLLSEKRIDFVGNMFNAEDRGAANFAADFYWHLFSSKFRASTAMYQTRLQWSQKSLYREGGYYFWLMPMLILNEI